LYPQMANRKLPETDYVCKFKYFCFVLKTFQPPDTNFHLLYVSSPFGEQR
jgi:hypothetical protein